MSIAIYLKSDATTYTLTSDVAYRVLNDSLPTFDWQLEGETLNEVVAGDITLTCENVTGWWTTWAAALNHTDRHPTRWYVEVWKESKLRWEGDVDYKSVVIDTKNLTCTFTVLGILSRLERYSAEDVKRDLPTRFDIGYGTGALSTMTDTTKNWPTDALASHVLIDDTDTCFTIASNTATVITVTSGSPSTGFYKVRPYVFKLSCCGDEKTCADAAVSSADDDITINTHGFESGDAVEYHSSAGNVITGLEDYRVYWVLKVDANQFQLCDTLADVSTSTAIDLTQPAGGDTHYFLHSLQAAALRAPSGASTDTVDLLDTGDVIRITRQGALPYRTTATKPGIVYSRTIYPKWDFDFEDVTALHVGPQTTAEPPQVEIDSGQLIIDQEYESVLGLDDGYLVITPYWRNKSVEFLVRRLLVSTGMIEGRDFVIAIPRNYANISIPYADFTGKNVVEALVELAALSGCCLYSTGTQIIFAGRDLSRPGAAKKTISSGDILADSLTPEWEHGYDFVTVKDGEDREVRRGRYTTTGNGLDIDTDYALRYPHMRAIAQRYVYLFCGRRKYREVTIKTNGGMSPTSDRGLFVGVNGNPPTGWTQYLTSGAVTPPAAGACWTVDVSYYCVAAPDDGDKLYMLSNDQVGPVRNPDIYCDVELPNLLNSWVAILACVPDYTTPSGWMLKVARSVGSALTIEEFTGTGTTTVRATDATKTFAHSTWYRCRFKVDGYEIKAKVWEKTATEPVEWDLEYTAAKKTTTGACGLAVYEDDASQPYYYFDNFLVVGACDFQLGWNVGDLIDIDSEEWYVVGLSEPIHALTYDDTITLQLVSARSYNPPLTWVEFNGSTGHARVGKHIETTEDFVDNANDEIDAGGHGFFTGMPVGYILRGGTGITGLTHETIYYAIRMNDDTFALATTYANALAGTKIAIAPPAAGAHTYGFYEVLANPAGSFSLLFWFQIDSSAWTEGDIILSTVDEANDKGIAIEERGTFGLGDCYLRFHMNGLTFGGLSYIDSEYIVEATMVAGVHIALTVNVVSNVARIWIDGNSSASWPAVTNDAITASPYPLTIGNWADLPAAHYCAVRLREVMLWDVALHQTEAARQTDVDAGTLVDTFPRSCQYYMQCRPRGDEPYLSLYLPCDEGYSAMLRDRTPWAHDGYGYDNQWDVPSSDSIVTGAKPEPPTILYYFGLFAPSSSDEMVVDTNLPSDRIFGFYYRVWASGGNSTSPEHEGFIPLGVDATPYYHGWPYTGGTVIVAGRYILTLAETYSGYNIDVAVVSFDGHMSDPSDPYICRNSHPAS